uniref:Transmembrane protein n=1 Tax=Panagrolaimus superbus TaxID=310955 RepID=A0A914YTZ3_9BILA
MNCCFKILFAAFLLLNFIGAANFQENASKNVQFLDGKIYAKSIDEILSDGADVGIQQGNDVMIIKEGSINLTLTFNELEFEVCKDDCIGEAQICYESLNGLDDTNAVGSCFKFPSSCDFGLKNGKYNDQIYFADTLVYQDSGCLKSKMKYRLAEVKHNLQFKSCDPNINPTDKMIKLQFIYLSSWPIIVVSMFL